jgi:hypothetical protein
MDNLGSRASSNFYVEDHWIDESFTKNHTQFGYMPSRPMYNNV